MASTSASGGGAGTIPQVEKLTNKPELAVAFRANGASLAFCWLNAPKVMLCGIFMTEKHCCTVAAALS